MEPRSQTLEDRTWSKKTMEPLDHLLRTNAGGSETEEKRRELGDDADSSVHSGCAWWGCTVTVHVGDAQWLCLVGMHRSCAWWGRTVAVHGGELLPIT